MVSNEEHGTIVPTMRVSSKDTSMLYATPNKMTKWRVNTLFSKEPDTIAWLMSFRSGDVLIDVGANVGMYTIFAAAARDARVFAFEPEAQNFALLNRNIEINKFEDRVTAWPAALSDETKLGVLHIRSTDVGGSCNSFDQEVDFHLRPARFPHRQGAVSVRLDDLVGDGTIPPPHHIKIDVDGFEHKVIAGARRVLDDPSLQSVLIEINIHIDEHRALIQEMRDHGFHFDDTQVESSRRKEGTFEGIGNYIFRRVSS